MGTLASSESLSIHELSSSEEKTLEINHPVHEEEEDEAEEEMDETSSPRETTNQIISRHSNSPIKNYSETKIFKKPTTQQPIFRFGTKSYVKKIKEKNSQNSQKDPIHQSKSSQKNSNLGKPIPKLLKPPMKNSKESYSENPFMNNLSQNLTQIVAEHPSQILSSVRNNVQDLSSDNLTSAITRFKDILQENNITLSQGSQFKDV